MSIKQKIIITTAAVSMLFGSVGSLALASPVTAASECPKTAILQNVCKSSGGEVDGKGTIMSILLLVINILAVGVGIAAVGGVVYAAILYTTAEDKAAQVTKAKMIIFNVVLGVVAYFLMFSFLQFLIPGGVFNK